MKKETEAVLMRIFIDESDRYGGKPLYKYLTEWFREEGLAGTTVLRGIVGFGKTSHIHTTSILRLSSGLPIVIEVVDKEENIERVKPKLEGIIEGGLITEEKVRIVYYEADSNEKT